MRIGVVVPQHEIGTDPGTIVAWARTAEELGFHYLDVFDHVVGADVRDRPDWPGPYTHRDRFHEPFVLLAFLAGQVDLELATGVLVLPQRQTVLVAKQAAALDVLSGGRVRLGVGIGWNPVEYEALGCTFGDRARRYEEQIDVLRRLWCEPVVDLDGTHHRIDRAGLAPLPVQRPVPVWMGGGAHAAVLDRIGRLADGWIVHDPNAGPELAGAWREIADSAARAGRDAGTIGLQGRIDVFGPLDRDRFRRSLDRWRRSGATHVSLHANGLGDARAHLELLPVLAELASDHLSPAPRGDAR